MSTGDRRRRDLAAIHTGRRQLGWDDETYRAALVAITGKSSAGELNDQERGLVLNRMRDLGFGRGPGVGAKQVNPQIVLAQQLWKRLAAAGALRKPSDAGLQGFGQRVTGRSRLEWCSPSDLVKVIEGLKAWVERAEAPGPQSGKDV